MAQSAWPNGFVVRAPRPDEARAVADLIIARNLADFGEPEWDLQDTLSDWNRLGFDRERDARVVVAPDGRLAAYVDVHKRPNSVRVGENAGLHADFRDSGLEAALIELAETLAAQHLAPQVRWMSEAGRGRMLTAHGYTPARWHWQMRIELTEPPHEPKWPVGFDIRIMREEDERATYELIEKAFTRPDRAPLSFEEWRRYMIERDDVDRSLQFIAVRRDEIAGAALCMAYFDPDEGWVRQLAVEEKHRGLGLGAALLRHAFGQFYQRGITRVGLGVDAHNPSATKLYKGLGMTPVREYIEYLKPA